MSSSVLDGSGVAGRCGLQVRDGIPLDTWTAMGERIAAISNASAWWLGDWLAYGQRTFGARYKVALQSTGLDYQTLRNYAWIARRFTMSRRRDTLSFQHHVEVAALPDATQELWLDRAERFRWSRNELRKRVRAAIEVRDDNRPAPGVVIRFDVTSQRERRWRDAAAQTDLPFGDWLATAADAAAALTLERSDEARAKV